MTAPVRFYLKTHEIEKLRDLYPDALNPTAMVRNAIWEAIKPHKEKNVKVQNELPQQLLKKPELPSLNWDDTLIRY